MQSISSNATQADDFLSHYHKYDEIITFMKNISDTYPDLVDLFTIGKTYEGRDIWGITIKSKRAREEPTSVWTEMTQWWNPQVKKTKKHHKEMELIMHGGQHAREWVSVVSWAPSIGKNINMIHINVMICAAENHMLWYCYRPC